MLVGLDGLVGLNYVFLERGKTTHGYPSISWASWRAPTFVGLFSLLCCNRLFEKKWKKRNAGFPGYHNGYYSSKTPWIPSHPPKNGEKIKRWKFLVYQDMAMRIDQKSTCAQQFWGQRLTLIAGVQHFRGNCPFCSLSVDSCLKRGLGGCWQLGMTSILVEAFPAVHSFAFFWPNTDFQ